MHSPRAFGVDEQFVPGQCHAGAVNTSNAEYRPDSSCRPEVVDTAITEANIGTRICESAYTSTVRPPASVTDRFKVASLADYGEVEDHNIELEHVVFLEIGGAKPASNLWPGLNRTGATGTTNLNVTVEGTLHGVVCARKVTLGAAQNAIASDWARALHKPSVRLSARGI